ncbi:MAG: GNAT family N-acetyltransferase, partial [Thermoplasmata archaeon]|nr:GNAT family N-acetyltransferase [Thermoplasmata archaeon]
LVVGFGFLHPHNRISTFSSTAEITYFIDPEHRRRGIGSLLFEALVNAGRKKGIESILAAISSENLESLEFHRKLGFAEVGRFKGILRKNGKVLDVVWMQKIGL